MYHDSRESVFTDERLILFRSHSAPLSSVMPLTNRLGTVQDGQSRPLPACAPVRYSREERRRHQRLTLNRLRRDVAGWNDWRKRRPDVIPDLYEADLHGANLNGAD